VASAAKIFFMDVWGLKKKGGLFLTVGHRLKGAASRQSGNRCRPEKNNNKTGAGSKPSS
jgi:hypothetical protein